MIATDQITELLNSYREEIRARSPRSLAIWCNNRTVMPSGVGSIFRLADPFPMVVKKARGARI
jgi:glutamate-1-semialdehyde aminotransferase